MNKIDIGQITTKSTESCIQVAVRDKTASGVVIRVMMEDMDKLADAVAYLTPTEAMEMIVLLGKAIEKHKEMSK